MFGRDARFYLVITVLLCLRNGAIAAPAPAEHQAAISLTPLDGGVDELIHHSTAHPSKDAKSVMQDLLASYITATSETLGDGCTEDNILIRREWGDLTEEERRAYIAALKCLHDLPSRTPRDLAPGALSYYDDFVVAHVLAADLVHKSPWLLAWHRHFLYSFERALREKCHYEGAQPYWDWSRNLDQPIETWPIFDGSDTSLSGNGKEDTPEKGCTCVTEGPFADWEVHLGPVAGNEKKSCTPNPQDDGLGLNTRCLERLFQPEYLGNLTYQNVTFTINNFEDPDSFGVRIESWPVGIHPLPHIFVGRLNEDVPASPSDPWFMCHHTMLDRVWSIWQSIDPETRTTQLPKAEAYAALRKTTGPAAAISMDDDIQLSPIFESVKVRDVMSTTSGQYCYRYDFNPKSSESQIGRTERVTPSETPSEQSAQVGNSGHGEGDGNGDRVAALHGLQENVPLRQKQSASRPATGASAAAWKQPAVWADGAPVSLVAAAVMAMVVWTMR